MKSGEESVATSRGLTISHRYRRQKGISSIRNALVISRRFAWNRKLYASDEILNARKRIQNVASSIHFLSRTRNTFLSTLMSVLNSKEIWQKTEINIGDISSAVVPPAALEKKEICLEYRMDTWGSNIEWRKWIIPEGKTRRWDRVCYAIQERWGLLSAKNVRKARQDTISRYGDGGLLCGYMQGKEGRPMNHPIPTYWQMKDGDRIVFSRVPWAVKRSRYFGQPLIEDSLLNYNPNQRRDEQHKASAAEANTNNNDNGQENTECVQLDEMHLKRKEKKIKGTGISGLMRSELVFLQEKEKKQIMELNPDFHDFYLFNATQWVCRKSDYALLNKSK